MFSLNTSKHIQTALAVVCIQTGLTRSFSPIVPKNKKNHKFQFSVMYYTVLIIKIQLLSSWFRKVWKRLIVGVWFEEGRFLNPLDCHEIAMDFTVSDV